MYLAEATGCTIAELGERMSSQEYAIRRHFYYARPVGIRQLAILLAQALDMYYSVHKAADAPTKGIGSWLEPSKPKEEPQDKPATFNDLQEFLNGRRSS